MAFEASPAAPYNGVFLSMNVCGVSTPKKEDIEPGVLFSWRSAFPLRPTIILLQEYKLANAALKPLCTALEAESGDPWTYIRQWSDSTDRDTVVLYNAAEFRGKEISSTKYMKEASSKSEIKRILGDTIDIEKVASYRARWAGAQLAPYDTTAPRGVSRTQFLIVSYHGRERRRQVPKPKSQIGAGIITEKDKYTSLKAPIKKILARDFAAQVALQSVHSTFAFGVHKEGNNIKGIPALITGDWNTDFDVFENFAQDGDESGLWKCSAEAPLRTKPHLSVRTTADGELKSDIDYVVALNHIHDHELSCDVVVTKVEALVHDERYRKEKIFDHDPLLVHFCVRPRYPHGRKTTPVTDATNSSLGGVSAPASAVQRPPQRLAAQVANEKIKKLSGKEMKNRAGKRPASIALDLTSWLHSEESPTPVKLPASILDPLSATLSAIESAAVQAQREEILEERTIVLSRCPKRYDLTKTKGYTQTQLLDAIKAMALDALGVENVRGKKINKEHEAEKQPWWPKKVKTLEEFKSLTESKRFKLYEELQGLLLAKGIGAEAMEVVAKKEKGGVEVETGGNLVREGGGRKEGPAPQGNILTAKSLGEFVRKGLKRLTSRDKAAREP